MLERITDCVLCCRGKSVRCWKTAWQTTGGKPLSQASWPPCTCPGRPWAKGAATPAPGKWTTLTAHFFCVKESWALAVEIRLEGMSLSWKECNTPWASRKEYNTTLFALLRGVQDLIWSCQRWSTSLLSAVFSLLGDHPWASSPGSSPARNPPA